MSREEKKEEEGGGKNGLKQQFLNYGPVAHHWVMTEFLVICETDWRELGYVHQVLNNLLLYLDGAPLPNHHNCHRGFNCWQSNTVFYSGGSDAKTTWVKHSYVFSIEGKDGT